MTKSEDSIFYGSYGIAFISLGLWLVIWALGLISGEIAVLLWILTIGIIILLVSNIIAQKSKNTFINNNLASLFGSFLIFISLSLLGLIMNILNYSITIGLIIIFAGIGLFIFGILLKNR